MSNKFAAGMQQAAITAVEGDTGTDAVGEIAGVAAKRGWIYDMLFSQGSAAGDGTIRWEVPRMTVSGAGSAAVENQLDPDGDAPLCLVEEEIATTGPTVTADSQLLDFDLNQRASFRWVASPDGEIIIPSTAANGIFFNGSNQGAVYAGICRCTIHWEE